MRNLSIALFCALFISSLAHASGERSVVTCTDTRFSDLTKIEIIETELVGQYQIVETLRDFENGKDVTQPIFFVFGMQEIEKSELPALTPWNGYRRTLIRHGRENYSIMIQDECGSSFFTISCKEAF